jgi:hypothetical protein
MVMVMVVVMMIHVVGLGKLGTRRRARETCQGLDADACCAEVRVPPNTNTNSLLLAPLRVPLSLREQHQIHKEAKRRCELYTMNEKRGRIKDAAEGSWCHS